MEIKNLTLPNNVLLIEEHPVVVPDTHNGIMLNPERVEQLKSTRRFRTGVVVAEGLIEGDTLSSLLNGKSSFIGQTIIYDSSTADLIDTPFDRASSNKLVSINANYIFAVVELDTETPNTID